MTARLRRFARIITWLSIVLASHATHVPSCSMFFGSPSALGCYPLVWAEDALPQDGTIRFFLNYGSARPPWVPQGAWSKKVFLPVLRENSMLRSVCVVLDEDAGNR